MGYTVRKRLKFIRSWPKRRAPGSAICMYNDSMYRHYFLAHPRKLAVGMSLP